MDYQAFKDQLSKLTLSDLASEYKRVVKDSESLERQEEKLDRELRQIKEAIYMKRSQQQLVEQALLRKTLE